VLSNEHPYRDRVPLINPSTEYEIKFRLQRTVDMSCRTPSAGYCASGKLLIGS
jgi:hypothetical protein